MKAAVYDHPGPPEVLRYEEVPDPLPGPGEILIDVEAISIEGGDAISRLSGEVPHPGYIVGYQSAGVVAECGPGVDELAVGDRVVGVGADGSHAARRVVAAGFAWKVPAGLDLPDAACVPVAFGTAHDCLFEFGRLQPGETVLVHAGAGGVGVAAIQMAHQAGARVLTTASSDDRLGRLGELGADEGINYRNHDFVAETRRLTDGQGVDVIVDSVGGENLQRSLQALAYRGRCISVGDAGRAAAERLDVSGMKPNNQTLTGYFLGAEMILGRRAHDMIAGILGDVADGTLRTVIDRTFPLADAADAHRHVESRQAFGRVLLSP